MTIRRVGHSNDGYVEVRGNNLDVDGPYNYSEAATSDMELEPQESRYNSDR